MIHSLGRSSACSIAVANRRGPSELTELMTLYCTYEKEISHAFVKFLIIIDVAVVKSTID